MSEQAASAGDKKEDGKAGSDVARKRPRDEYERVLGYTFDDFCRHMLDVHRPAFMHVRWRAYLRSLQNAEQLTSDRERDDAENYLSWWLLRFWYEGALKPRSVRQLLALRALTLVNHTSPALSDRLPSMHKKRLPVVLFECPENYELIQKFTDQDDSIVRWLHRQKVRSCWRGDRYFEINDVKHFSDSYAYRYLMYRLDLGIALPVSENTDDHIPSGLLPKPAGPNLREYQLFYPRQRHPRRTGVARQVDHSLVPANCYYMFGLHHQIDLAWDEPRDGTGLREKGRAFDSHRLIYEWPDHFYFPDIVNQPGKRPGTIEATIQRYLTEIVIPLGSIQLGRYVEDKPFEPAPSTSSALGDEPTLLGAECGRVIGYEGFETFRSIAGFVRMGARRIDYFDTLAPGSFAAHESRRAADVLFKPWLMLIEGVLPLENNDGGVARQSRISVDRKLKGQMELVRRWVPKYRWIINDVRCAWHAARIYLTEIDGPLIALSKMELKSGARTAADYVYKSRIQVADPSWRYVLSTRASMKRWLGLAGSAKFVKELWRPWLNSEHIRDAFKNSSLQDAQHNEIESRPPWRFAEALIRTLTAPEHNDGMANGPGAVSAAERKAQNPSERGSKRKWRHGRIEVENLHAAVEKYVRLELIALIEHSGFELTSNAIKRILDGKEGLERHELDLAIAARRNVRPEGSWPLLIDPSVKVPPPNDDGSVRDVEGDAAAFREAMKNRITRSHMAFINAVAPTLPSAIHLEVAAIEHRIRSGLSEEEGRKYAAISSTRVLVGWRVLVNQFLSFTLRYRALLEIDHLRQSAFQARQPKEWRDRERLDAMAKAGLHLALTPDYSPVTLGLIGLKCFGTDSGGRPTALKALAPFDSPPDGNSSEVKREHDRVITEGIASQRGLLHDALHNLVECLNFIDALDMIVSGEARKREAAAAAKTEAAAAAKMKAEEAARKAAEEDAKKAAEAAGPPHGETAQSNATVTPPADGGATETKPPAQDTKPAGRADPVKRSPRTAAKPKPAANKPASKRRRR